MPSQLFIHSLGFSREIKSYSGSRGRNKLSCSLSTWTRSLCYLSCPPHKASHPSLICSAHSCCPSPPPAPQWPHSRRDAERSIEERTTAADTHLSPSLSFPLSHSGALSAASTELAPAHTDAPVRERGGGRESVTITHRIPQMCTRMCVQSLQTHYRQLAFCRVVGVCPASQDAVFD